MEEPITDAKQWYWGGRNGEFSSKDQERWFNKMFDKKWIVPYWESKYGGGGLNPKQNNILNQEMSRLGCRKPHINFGISMLGSYRTYWSSRFFREDIYYSDESWDPSS